MFNFRIYFKYMHQLPKRHKNCSCKTFLSTFLVQLLERFCCSWMHPNLTIRQWGVLPEWRSFHTGDMRRVFLPCVDSSMVVHATICGEWVVTRGAGAWLFSRVAPPMNFKFTFEREILDTLEAGIRFLSGICYHVFQVQIVITAVFPYLLPSSPVLQTPLASVTMLLNCKPIWLKFLSLHIVHENGHLW